MANFRGLVLGYIEAEFCKETFVGIGIWFEKEIEKKGHRKRLKNENLDKCTQHLTYILREVLLNIAQLSIARQEQLVGKLLMRSIRFTYASMGEKITEIENEIFKL